MADIKPRFTTRFRVTAHLYTPPATEQMEATASLDKLRALLPRDIDPESHPTLLFVAGNLAVGGVTNLNDDAMLLEDTIRTYRAFEWQLVDIEHLRSDIKGFIVKAGLSELGTDRLITEEEARAAGKPVNVAIVVALWKVADADLCAFIQQMDAPASPDKDKLSFSFEVGFDDYDIVVLPMGASNLALASQIVTPDAPEFPKLDRLLRVNGGKGMMGKDSRVARIIMGNIIPLGAGIVATPAAAVKGLTTITTSPHPDVSETDAGLYKYSSTQATLSAEDAAPFLAYAAAIPDDHVFTDPDDPTLGREREPHVTVCYGLTTADPSAVQSCLAECGPVSMTLGEVSAFIRDDKDYDVLKVDVESDDLHRLNSLVKTATEVKSSFPDYHPHLTLAYVKKGMARHYVGDARFKGRGLTVPSITFSPHTGDRIEIPLKMLDGEKLAAPSPHTDPYGQVPVQPSVTPDTSMAQSDAPEVYSDDEAMATPSRQIKLSQGWQERLAALQAAAGKDPLVNGVNVTLSDGRTLSNVKVFDGQTLELDKELSMSGVVITDMTPGVPPQADSPEMLHPHKTLVYPTTTPEKQAGQDVENNKMHEGQQAAYTDAALAGDPLTEDEVIAAAKDAKKPYGDVQYADPGYQKDGKKRYPIDTETHIRAAWSYINQSKNAAKYTSEQVKHIKSKIVSAWKKHIDPKGPESAKASVTDLISSSMQKIQDLLAEDCFASLVNTTAASVSPSNPTSSPMNLSELKQSLAAVKTVEELPTAIANVAFFAEEMAKASEQIAAERKTAQEAAKAAQASVDQIKADLEKLTKTHNEMVAAQQAAAAEKQYQDHMAAVEATFDLDDEVRAEIVDEVKAASSDEAFAKWMTSAKKKMKGFMKKGEKPGDKKDDKEPDGDDDDAKAAKAAKIALASAAANIVDAPVAHNFEVTPTLVEQMKATFAKNVSIGGVKVEDITKRAKK